MGMMLVVWFAFFGKRMIVDYAMLRQQGALRENNEDFIKVCNIEFCIKTVPGRG